MAGRIIDKVPDMAGVGESGFGLPGVGKNMRPRAQMKLDPRSIKAMSDKMQRSIQKALDMATVLLREEAEDIKRESQQMVPYRTGNLHDSAHYRVRRGGYVVTADIWYDAVKAPYAWLQHETKPSKSWKHPIRMRSGAPPFAKDWKFLEKPIQDHEQNMDNIWVRSFRGVFD